MDWLEEKMDNLSADCTKPRKCVAPSKISGLLARTGSSLDGR